MAVLASLSPTALSVAPGLEAVCEVRVRNTGDIVRDFTVEVLGDAAPWVEVAPDRVSLFPGTDAVAVVRFRPPRQPGGPAGPVPFGVRVAPGDDPSAGVVEEGVVDVGAFFDVSARLVPRGAEGGRSSRHRVEVDNLGNVPVDAAVAAGDPDERLVFQVEPARIRVGPGEQGAARVRVVSRKRPLLRADRQRPFQVSVEPEHAPPVRLDGYFTPTPVLPARGPRLLIALFALVAIAAAASVALRPQLISGTFSKTEPKEEAKDAPNITAPSIPTSLPGVTLPGGGTGSGAGATTSTAPVTTTSLAGDVTTTTGAAGGDVTTTTGAGGVGQASTGRTGPVSDVNVRPVPGTFGTKTLSGACHRGHTGSSSGAGAASSDPSRPSTTTTTP